MTKSAFELRNNVIDTLLHMNSQERALVKYDLQNITDVVKYLDQITSGNFDAPLPSYATGGFKTFVSAQKILHPRDGLITPVYHDWYDHEITRLTNRSESIIESIYMPRQIGMSTFIRLYAAFMRTRGFTVAVLVRTSAEARGVSAEYPDLLISDRMSGFRGHSIDQLLADCSNISFVDKFQMNEGIRSILPHMKSNTDGPSGIFSYQTIE